MAIYTSNYLKDLSQRKTALFSKQILNESKKIHTSFDIFLSHSFLDKDVVEGLYIELKNLGYTVYVDWIIDPELNRNNVTKGTATLVRNRLKSSTTLLLAVSVNSAISKWVPWELGLVDGSTQKCAIIPVSKSAPAPNSYIGMEYLTLYPFIKKVSTTKSRERLFVIEAPLKYIIFDEWLIPGKQPKTQTINIY